ncbi:MAG TPA: zf-HC2 domain-containing protein [Gemmatimonadales bacterium]|nr:zf-HC2 domain-containing protein [Gemmatimonadales bacterium]
MILLDCDRVRDLLPDYAAGRLEPATVAAVEAHLRSCDECRGESAIIGLLARHPAPLPGGLEARVLAATAPRRRVPYVPASALLAASVAAALLGGVTILRHTRGPEAAPPAAGAAAAGVDGRGLMMRLPGSADDGLAAGSASLDDLSEDELQSLLKELNS